MTRLPEPFHILLQAIQSADFRLPVLVEGEADWAYAWVMDCLAQLSATRHPVADQNDILWYSHRAPAGAWQLSENRIHHELGREAKHLVFDCFAGINVDALAAMSGALVKGGCLFVLCPPLNQIEHFADPYNERLAVVPWGVERVSRHYLARLGRLLEASQQLVRIRQDAQSIYPDQLPVPVIQSWSEPLTGLHSSPGSLGATADQHAAVQAVLKTLTGHRNRPVVLIADRGRGKSAAIGLALKTLHGQGKSILVTAPRLESVETLFSFAGRPHHERKDADFVDFYAPDHLLDTLPKADLLVVDEAAAIAPDMLVRMLKHYSRVVMATTVQGYEGTGRGFETRFAKFLDQHYPDWKRIELLQPIRWQQGDWLEQLTNSILMPSNKQGDKAAWSESDEILDRIASLEDAGVCFSRLQFNQVAEAELAEIFDLLTDAHYRTRPSDLRTLMDAVNVRCYVAKSADRLLGIAMIAEEGQLDGELAAEILAGRRRPNGQILPQTMAVHLGIDCALQSRFWRVVRIAIQPGFQLRGLGSKLLDFVRDMAKIEHIDALGSVFSATPDLLSYWGKNGMSLLRIGYTREATSGGYSALVMQPLSSEGAAMVGLARNRFTEDLAFSLLDTHRHLPAQLVLKVISMAVTAGHTDIELKARDQQFVSDFLTGRRVYENGSASLWRWVWHWMNSHSERLGSLASFPELIILRIVQNLSWSEVIVRLQLTGQKQARKQLREALLQLTTLNNESERQ